MNVDLFTYLSMGIRVLGPTMIQSHDFLHINHSDHNI